MYFGSLLVPYDNVHMVTYCHCFLLYYPFYTLFLYFILQVKTLLDTSQGLPPPHQTAGNVINGNPSRSASSRARKGGYGKRSAVDPTAANTGVFHPSLFVLLLSTRMPLIFYRPIPHGVDCLHMALPPPRRWPQRPPGLAIGKLNILDGRGFGMAQAIREVEREVFDMMMLTKTKIKSEAYSHNRLGYNVNFLAARPSSNRGTQGGVGLVTRERPVGWGVESTHYHGANVVSCNILTGLTWTPLVRAYLPPLTLEYLPDLEEALQRFSNPISLGDLNVDLGEARILRSQIVSDLLTEYGIIDLVRNFI